MATKPKISAALSKPKQDNSDKSDSFFSQALKTAKGESITEPEAKPEAKINHDQAPPLKPKKKSMPTVRENFDLNEDLRSEMRHFLSDSRKFRSKRDFLTQCLIDGLKKYDGQ